MSQKGKVLVAMSGGIDSTVVALMLHNEGYEVIKIIHRHFPFDKTNKESKNESEKTAYLTSAFIAKGIHIPRNAVEARAILKKDPTIGSRIE